MNVFKEIKTRKNNLLLGGANKWFTKEGKSLHSIVCFMFTTQVVIAKQQSVPNAVATSLGFY